MLMRTRPRTVRGRVLGQCAEQCHATVRGRIHGRPAGPSRAPAWARGARPRGRVGSVPFRSLGQNKTCDLMSAVRDIARAHARGT